MKLSKINLSNILLNQTKEFYGGILGPEQYKNAKIFFIVTFFFSLFEGIIIGFVGVGNIGDFHRIDYYIITIFSSIGCSLIIFLLFKTQSFSFSRNILTRIIFLEMMLIIAVFVSILFSTFIFSSEISIKHTITQNGEYILSKIHILFDLAKNDLLIFFTICLFTVFIGMVQFFIYLINNSISRKTSEILNEIENRTKSTVNQIDIFSSIQHELGNKIPSLKHDLNSIYNYFLTKKIETGNDLALDKIRMPLQGEINESIDTLKMVLDRMQNKIAYSINTLASLNDIINSDPTKFNPTAVNLKKYLKEECSKYAFDNKKVSINFIGDDTIIGIIDTKQFSFLIQNIISNAEKHGFTNPEKEYFILFYIDEYKNNLTIEILNNGNPIDKNYTIEDFKKPYNYIGKTGNSGLGGYLIGNIISNHNGKIFFGNQADFNKIINLIHIAHNKMLLNNDLQKIFASINSFEPNVHFKITLPKNP